MGSEQEDKVLLVSVSMPSDIFVDVSAVPDSVWSFGVYVDNHRYEIDALKRPAYTPRKDRA